MRCPSCQATNPDTAAFCGQCYERFEAQPVAVADPHELPDWLAVGAPAPPADADGPPGTPGTPGTPTAGEEPRPDGAGTPAERREAAAGRFRSDGVQARWTCVVCGEENSMEDFSCTVCGSRMDAEADPTAGVDWVAARRLELMAPGLGHLRAGQGGMGVARTTLVVLWSLGALALVLSGTAGVLAALPLVIGIVAIWVTGPSDLDALRVGRQPRLGGRTFLYLVIGVTIGVITLGGLGAAL